MDVKKFFKLFQPRRNAYLFEHGANLVRHSKPLRQLFLLQSGLDILNGSTLDINELSVFEVCPWVL